MPGEPELHPWNETQAKQDKETKHHHQKLAKHDDDVFLSFSSASQTLQQRSLSQEEHQALKRNATLFLLETMLIDFDNPRRFIASIDSKQLERLGAYLVGWSINGLYVYERYRNPAGYLRSVVTTADWEKPEDFDDDLHCLKNFYSLVLDILRVPVSNRECAQRLYECRVSHHLVSDLEEWGIKFVEETEQSAEDVEGWTDEDMEEQGW